MTRTVVLRVAAVTAVVAASLTGSPGPAPPASASHAGKPNVLFIITDDQRIESMGPMRRTRSWFKRGGTEYVNAFVTTPLCCPSRASIFTGRYAHNHRVRTNADASELDQRSTLQRYLKDDGYRTAIVGKYLNSWTGAPPHFEQWHTFENVSKYKGARFNSNGVVHKVKKYSTDYIANRARGLVRQFELTDTKPWFLVVSTWAPHTPAQAAKRHRNSKVGQWTGNPAVFEADRTDKPAYVQAKSAGFKGGRRLRERQLRTLKAVDDVVERLFTTLSELGEANQTLAFFLSDNGIMWAEHGMKSKTTPYTPAIKVPFFVRWPGHVPQKVADPRIAANIDIVPTVLEAAGIEPDPEFPLDGRSVLGAEARDRLLLELTGGNNQIDAPTWASTLTPAYQYVEYYDDVSGAVTFREYYDLINDPFQLENVLADPDPANDPPLDEQSNLGLQLARDRRCTGTDGLEPCP
ncbi:MAG: sulfatase family protein [Actinomycetota bacterium]